jgi:hypothetical protein
MCGYRRQVLQASHVDLIPAFGLAEGDCYLWNNPFPQTTEKIGRKTGQKLTSQPVLAVERRVSAIETPCR